MFVDVALVACALAIGYVIGGIPWSLIIGLRFYGVDLRSKGSGNLGATNVFRVLGARAAVVTLLLDAGKGAVAVAFAALITPSGWSGDARSWLLLATMAAAVLGHSYSPYIRLRGGKGVATSAGALFVLTPLAAAIELALFAGLVATTRIVSLSSVIIAFVYPWLVLVLYPDDTPRRVVAFALAALVIWRHRSNIVRIARGEESRISIRGRGSAASEREETSSSTHSDDSEASS